MYDSENLRTLEAIKRTVREVRSPTGSKIIGKVIFEELRLKISQWKIIVVCLRRNKKVMGVIRIVRRIIEDVKDFEGASESNMD